MKKIFVIIVTYKGKQWYDRCFTSLRESTIPVQTIVVDNASNDGSVEYIKEHYPEIILIESKENFGFGKANNVAMRYALDHNCDYVFLLNQDTWIKPDTLSLMLPIAELRKECGIFSPMHVNGEEKSLYIEIEDGYTDHANELLSDCYFQSLKELYYFKYVNAAAWLLPRNTLEVVGGFDPLFFLYGEDDNYLHRLEYHGLKVGLIPKAVIVHDHKDGKEVKTITYKNYRFWQTRLVEYLNIQHKLSAYSTISYYLRKIIVSVLCFDRKSFKHFLSELRFFLRHKKSIENSRRVNMCRGTSWL